MPGDITGYFRWQPCRKGISVLTVSMQGAGGDTYILPTYYTVLARGLEELIERCRR